MIPYLTIYISCECFQPTKPWQKSISRVYWPNIHSFATRCCKILCSVPLVTVTVIPNIILIDWFDLLYSNLDHKTMNHVTQYDLDQMCSCVAWDLTSPKPAWDSLWSEYNRVYSRTMQNLNLSIKVPLCCLLYRSRSSPAICSICV